MLATWSQVFFSANSFIYIIATLLIKCFFIEYICIDIYILMYMYIYLHEIKLPLYVPGIIFRKISILIVFNFGLFHLK